MKSLHLQTILILLKILELRNASINAKVFQTLVIAIIAMFMISQSEIITFAEEVFLIKILAFVDNLKRQ